MALSTPPGARPSWGDRHWHRLLEEHRDVVRRTLARFRSREINTTGGRRYRGIAVHIAARVLAQARELLCSRTVKDLVAGAGFAFTDRGIQRLKGVPDQWQLYAVELAER